VTQLETDVSESTGEVSTASTASHGATPNQRGIGGVFVGRRFPQLTISTPRLHVRQHTPADAEAVTGIFGDRLTQRWLPFSADEHGAIDGKAWCGEMAA